MRLLSLDSAGSVCAVCVLHDDRVVAAAEERMSRGQDARLVPLVLEVMAKATTTFDQLDRIAATRGPGSFTGLRIGLAAARGFGLAADKPVIGIDRFSLYRKQHEKVADDLLVVLESKRAELYVRHYAAQGDDKEACMMLPEEIGELARQHAQLTVVGDAIDIVRDVVPKSASCLEAVEPEVVTCARMAGDVHANDHFWLPRPYYLRPPDVTVSKKLTCEKAIES